MRSTVRQLLFSLSAFGLAYAAAAQAPGATQPPSTQHAVLTVQGTGSQVYGCQLDGGIFQWIFRAPAARLFDESGHEVGTHGDGPVWNYEDGSSIHGVVVGKTPSPDAASIPWLLLKAADPQGRGVLTTVEYVRRSNTQGGAAPKDGCDAEHAGTLLRVPYTATYTFYSSKMAAR